MQLTGGLSETMLRQILELLCFSDVSALSSVSKFWQKICSRFVQAKHLDFSFGKESIPIPCINSINSDPFPTDSFDYISQNMNSVSLKPSENLSTQLQSDICCQCKNSCKGDCLCLRSYVASKELPWCRLKECGSMCSCNLTCPTRVLQSGRTYRLYLFRTMNKGWSVRTADFISKGEFVIEFVGEVLSPEEGSKRRKIYESTGLNYMMSVREFSGSPNSSTEPKLLCTTTIDPTRKGNLARYINHSCHPNLQVTLVTTGGHTDTVAHMALFAVRDIRAHSELSFDYGGQSSGQSGAKCLCGSERCRGFLPFDRV
eukprot:94134_1